jgi:hypothetical protein
MYFFATLRKVSLADFLSSFYCAHFFSSELCSLWLTKIKRCYGLVGKKYFSVNSCDFLKRTDAVTENPHQYLAAEKHCQLNRLGQCQNVLKTLKTFQLLS